MLKHGAGQKQTPAQGKEQAGFIREAQGPVVRQTEHWGNEVEEHRNSSGCLQGEAHPPDTQKRSGENASQDEHKPAQAEKSKR